MGEPLRWLLTALAMVGVLPLLVAGYQHLLAGVHGWRNHYDRCGREQPRTTVVVPASAGDPGLAATVDHLLALDYPRDRLRLLVVDGDGIDHTRALLAGPAEGPPPPVAGAAGPVARAAPAAAGAAGGRGSVKARALDAGLPAVLADDWAEAVLIVDPGVICEPGALRALVRHLADPLIGTVVADVRVDGPDGRPDTAVGRFVAWAQVTSRAAGGRARNVLRVPAPPVGSLGGAVLHTRTNLEALGGRIGTGSVAEDTTTAFATQLSGRRVLFEPHAVAWAGGAGAGDDGVGSGGSEAGADGGSGTWAEARSGTRATRPDVWAGARSDTQADPAAGTRATGPGAWTGALSGTRAGAASDIPAGAAPRTWAGAASDIPAGAAPGGWAGAGSGPVADAASGTWAEADVGDHGGSGLVPAAWTGPDAEPGIAIRTGAPTGTGSGPWFGTASPTGGGAHPGAGAHPRAGAGTEGAAPITALWQRRHRRTQETVDAALRFRDLWFRRSPTAHGLGGIGFGLLWFAPLLLPACLIVSSAALVLLFLVGRETSEDAFRALLVAGGLSYAFVTVSGAMLAPDTARRAWREAVLFPGLVAVLLMLAACVPPVLDAAGDVTGVTLGPGPVAAVLLAAYLWVSACMPAAWLVRGLEERGAHRAAEVLLYVVGFAPLLAAATCAAAVEELRRRRTPHGSEPPADAPGDDTEGIGQPSPAGRAAARP